jgi:hypothetical protein
LNYYYVDICTVKPLKKVTDKNDTNLYVYSCYRNTCDVCTTVSDKTQPSTVGAEFVNCNRELSIMQNKERWCHVSLFYMIYDSLLQYKN